MLIFIEPPHDSLNIYIQYVTIWRLFRMVDLGGITMALRLCSGDAGKRVLLSAIALICSDYCVG